MSQPSLGSACRLCPPLSGLYRNGAKRVFDTLMVLLAAPVILPFILLLALLVRCDGGPAFYSQPRVGKGGRLYTMWKLRSMVVDADAKLEAYLDRERHCPGRMGQHPKAEIRSPHHPIWPVPAQILHG